MSVEAKVKKILLDNLDVKEADLNPEASLLTDLGATSVDIVEILAALENEFDIEVADEEAQKMRTVGDITAFIEAKQAAS